MTKYLKSWLGLEINIHEKHQSQGHRAFCTPDSVTEKDLYIDLYKYPEFDGGPNVGCKIYGDNG